MKRLALFSPIAASCLIGAAVPETRVVVTLPATTAADAGGRLLLFVAPATSANAAADSVNLSAPGDAGVSVGARDVAGFGPARAVTIDAQANAYPIGMAALPPGDYRLQAALDRDGSYAYEGRGPGDLVSRVITVHLPLAAMPSIALERALPPLPDQFDTAGLPPAAAQQIAASRPHLHDERIASAVLTRFRGLPQTVAAWVLTPPGYDPKARTTYPTVYTPAASARRTAWTGSCSPRHGTSWRRERSRR